MPTITFDKVAKKFGNFQALYPLDAEFADGEFTVLVGPSGCGKSTTLRVLAGLESVTSGEIRFDGKLISDKEPKDRDIAMVFQDYALYPHMNVAKNMSFALFLQGVAKDVISTKVNEVAAMLNITHLLDRKPAELSGGQRQRVAMGRALVRNTSTFLFDEPLSNLDAKLRSKLRTELAEMHQQLSKNMVYVTHDQIEAMTLGDRIVVMSEGVLQQQGSPQQLYLNPTNRFVAGFIGSPAMNFLFGELSNKAGQLVVVGNGFELSLTPDCLADASQPNDGKVELGIRPHRFLAAPIPGASPITLTVVVAEYLGDKTVLFTRCADHELLVEHDTDTPVEIGSQVTFYIAPENILVFDHASGQRLSNTIKQY